MLRFLRRRSLRVQLTIIILAMVMIPLGILFLANRYYIQNRMFK